MACTIRGELAELRRALSKLERQNAQQAKEALEASQRVGTPPKPLERILGLSCATCGHVIEHRKGN
jgi:hypothetical protein